MSTGLDREVHTSTGKQPGEILIVQFVRPQNVEAIVADEW